MGNPSPVASAPEEFKPRKCVHSAAATPSLNVLKLGETKNTPNRKEHDLRTPKPEPIERINSNLSTVSLSSEDERFLESLFANSDIHDIVLQKEAKVKDEDGTIVPDRMESLQLY